MRFFILLLVSFAAAAQAQFEVELKLPRSSYVALENIPATVNVTNRSGADVVLGGPGRSSWLSINLTDSAGHTLAPIEVDGSQLTQIPAGGTISRQMNVTEVYSPTQIGNYALVASIHHSPTNDYYGSNRVLFSIADSKPLWEQVYGVPDGFKDAGKLRKYVLGVFRDLDSTSLYFHWVDDRSGLRLRSYRLGPLSMVYDPQISLDSKNQLQVLFLAQPKLFAHVIIAPDGELKKRTYYLETAGSRPALVQATKGDLAVQGGEIYDPAAPAPVAKGGEGKPGRNVSDRPPGL